MDDLLGVEVLSASAGTVPAGAIVRAMVSSRSTVSLALSSCSNGRQRRPEGDLERDAQNGTYFVEKHRIRYTPFTRSVCGVESGHSQKWLTNRMPSRENG